MKSTPTEAGITLVVTSCGRIDLLQRTLDSFFEKNTCGLAHHVLVDDSGKADVHEWITARYGDDFELVLPSKQGGQMAAIDRAYARVKTPYIFHCEDDWVFRRAGFIEQSLSVLEENEDGYQVWLRDFNEFEIYTFGTEPMYTANEVAYRRVCPKPGTGWYGFSFNPGLMRKSSYERVMPYTALGHECAVGRALDQAGQYALVLEQAATGHIGADRHVRDPVIAARAKNNKTLWQRIRRGLADGVRPKGGA